MLSDQVERTRWDPSLELAARLGGTSPMSLLPLRSRQHSGPRLSGNFVVSEEFITFHYYMDTKEQVDVVTC